MTDVYSSLLSYSATKCLYVRYIRVAGEGGDIWNDGGTDQERNSVQRMVGRHQGMVRRKIPHTQQEGAGSRHIENGGEYGNGQLRALSPWSNGWILHFLRVRLWDRYSVSLPCCHVN